MVTINEDLLSILVCPECRAPVIQDENGIKCTNKKCGLIYPVHDGVPVMLVEKAVSIGSDKTEKD